MDKIKRLKIPLLADGKYTEWAFKMVQNLNKNTATVDVDLRLGVESIMIALVKADREYNKAYEIFLNHNYMLDDNRNLMEEALVLYEMRLGRMLLHLINLMGQVGITPFILEEHYKNIVKENNLSILQGADEPLNLSLQIGHWENYLMSEVGWSLRGAFSIVPPGDIAINTKRGYIGNRVSNDSVYVMRVKQWDVTIKVLEILDIKSQAKMNIKAMELWGAVFNYLNYVDATPIRLWGIILDNYTQTINMMEDANK